jgi:hypothetical protein
MKPLDLERFEGHDKPCYYCGELCNSLAGNPGLWPVAGCHPDEPGVTKYHHSSCTFERADHAIAELKALRAWREAVNDALWLVHGSLPKSLIDSWRTSEKELNDE